MKYMKDKIIKPRNYEMRNIFKWNGMFAHWLLTQETFIMADFRAYCKEKGLSNNLNHFYNCLARGFASAGILTRTGNYRRQSSTSPASPVWKVVKIAAKE
jgi:hypothetical protein